MRFLLLGALLLAATPALAQPAPAGSCRLDEGLVLTQNPPPAGPDEVNPWVLSMTLPRMGGAIADISLHIAADGSATDVKLLCLWPTNTKLEDALKSASKTWKFKPMMRSGKPAAADASYRISSAGIMPLSFVAEKLRPIEG